MIYYIFEVFSILITFFTPNILIGYINPPLKNPIELMNSPLHLTIYILLSFLQLLLMLFLIRNNKDVPVENYGIVKIQLKNFFTAILLSFGLFFIYFFLAWSISFLPDFIEEIMTTGFRWKLKNHYMIPLIFIFCLLTGYREELLFRSYIITRLSQLGIPVIYTLFLGSLTFSVLHLYEGISAFIFALLSGIYFSFVYITKKNLHIIALSHGIFNFCALLLTFIE